MKTAKIIFLGFVFLTGLSCKKKNADIIYKTASVTGNKGLGVLYWEPEAYNNWQGYTLGAFDNSGKPTAALNAFQ